MKPEYQPFPPYPTDSDSVFSSFPPREYRSGSPAPYSREYQSDSRLGSSAPYSHEYQSDFTPLYPSKSVSAPPPYPGAQKRRRRRRVRVRERFLTPLRALYVLLLVVALFFLLTACAIRGSRTTAPSTPDPTPVGMPDYLICEIEKESVSDVSRSDDGVILAAYSYQIPVMRIYRRNGAPVTFDTAANERETNAVQIAETFNQAFAEWQIQADFPELEDLARQDYASRQEEKASWNYHYEQGLETSVYQTDRLVSVSGRFYYYAGGAHPNTVLLGWNYDLEQGSFFYAGQLFQDTEAVTEELLQMARTRASEWNTEPQEFFWQNYADILRAWSENSAVVTFDEDRMTVSFSPYDIASYAAGEQVFSLSRPWLEPYLNAYGKRLLSQSDA